NGSSARSAAATTPIPVIDFASTFPNADPTKIGLQVPTGPSSSLYISSSQRIVAASGIVTLGIAEVSVTAGISFEQTTQTDNTPAIKIAVSNLGLTLGTFTLDPSTSTGGLFYITRAGVAGQVTLPGIHFSVGDATNGASFTADLAVQFNTSGQKVDQTFNLAGGGTDRLTLDPGPFFRGTLTLPAANPLTVHIGGVLYTLSGAFQLEQVTVGGVKEIRIGAANVNSTFCYTLPSGGGTPGGCAGGQVSVTLSNGEGGLIVMPGGVAAQLRGGFHVDVSALGRRA